MKLSKLLIIAIAALFFSACTTEEDGSFTRHELVFQVCMGNNETRAITDNSWSEGDFIFVKVGEDVKQYKITFDENSIPIAEGVDADNTFFWEDLAVSSVTVTAWSFGKKYVDSLKGTITLESDQSNEEDFYNSDTHLHVFFRLPLLSLLLLQMKNLTLIMVFSILFSMTEKGTEKKNVFPLFPAKSAR